VATGGDELADAIAAAGAGATVEPGDAVGFSSALSRYLEDEGLRSEARAQALKMAAELTWDRQLAPLLAYCRAPWRAPKPAAPAAGAQRAGYLARRLLDYARAGEWRVARNRIKTVLRRR
jgi:hypothetical protein